MNFLRWRCCQELWVGAGGEEEKEDPLKKGKKQLKEKQNPCISPCIFKSFSSSCLQKKSRRSHIV